MASQTLRAFIASKSPLVAAARASADAASARASDAFSSASRAEAAKLASDASASSMSDDLATMLGYRDGTLNAANDALASKNAASAHAESAASTLASAVAAETSNAQAHELAAALSFVSFSASPSGASNRVNLVLRSNGTPTDWNNAGQPYEAHLLLRYRTDWYFALLGDDVSYDPAGRVLTTAEVSVSYLAPGASTVFMQRGNDAGAFITAGFAKGDFARVGFSVTSGALEFLLNGESRGLHTGLSGVRALSVLASLSAPYGPHKLDFAEILLTAPLTAAERRMAALPPREKILAKFDPGTFANGVFSDRFGGPLSLALGGPGSSGSLTLVV